MDAPKIASATTVVLGIIIVGLGWHAYFKSNWNQSMRDSHLQDECKQVAQIVDKTCPSLALEMFFISISLVTFITSAGFLINELLVQNDAIKRFAPVYNAAAAVLLFIGGIFVIVSAAQVNSLVKAAANYLHVPYDRNEGQYYDEKIAAGALSFIATIFYGAAAFLGFTGSSTHSRFS